MRTLVFRQQVARCVGNSSLATRRKDSPLARRFPLNKAAAPFPAAQPAERGSSSLALSPFFNLFLFSPVRFSPLLFSPSPSLLSPSLCSPAHCCCSLVLFFLIGASLVTTRLYAPFRGERAPESSPSATTSLFMRFASSEFVERTRLRCALSLSRAFIPIYSRHSRERLCLRSLTFLSLTPTVSPCLRRWH